MQRIPLLQGIRCIRRTLYYIRCIRCTTYGVYVVLYTLYTVYYIHVVCGVYVVYVCGGISTCCIYMLYTLYTLYSIRCIRCIRCANLVFPLPQGPDNLYATELVYTMNNASATPGQYNFEAILGLFWYYIRPLLTLQRYPGQYNFWRVIYTKLFLFYFLLYFSSEISEELFI